MVVKIYCTLCGKNKMCRSQTQVGSIPNSYQFCIYSETWQKFLSVPRPWSQHAYILYIPGVGIEKVKICTSRNHNALKQNQNKVATLN